jgi:hypothetical protein
VTLGVGDAAIEAERAGEAVRVIAVRGDVGWQLPDHQGRLEQGQSLEGSRRLAVREAGVWDDWTGGAASPQGAAQRGALGSGEALIHTADGEAPTPLAVNEHRVGVTVEGDAAVTTVVQRFFNGSDQTAPVEYRVRIPDGAIVAGFAVERNDQIVRAAPGTVAGMVPNGGTGALIAAPDGGLFARLDALAPGRACGATCSTSSGSTTTAGGARTSTPWATRSRPRSSASSRSTCPWRAPTSPRCADPPGPPARATGCTTPGATSARARTCTSTCSTRPRPRPPARASG